MACSFLLLKRGYCTMKVTTRQLPVQQVLVCDQNRGSRKSLRGKMQRVRLPGLKETDPAIFCKMYGAKCTNGIRPAMIGNTSCTQTGTSVAGVRYPDAVKCWYSVKFRRFTNGRRAQKGVYCQYRKGPYEIQRKGGTPGWQQTSETSCRSADTVPRRN